MARWNEAGSVGTTEWCTGVAADSEAVVKPCGGRMWGSKNLVVVGVVGVAGAKQGTTGGLTEDASARVCLCLCAASST